jgi:hypothetical protein
VTKTRVALVSALALGLNAVLLVVFVGNRDDPGDARLPRTSNDPELSRLQHRLEGLEQRTRTVQVRLSSVESAAPGRSEEKDDNEPEAPPPEITPQEHNRAVTENTKRFMEQSLSRMRSDEKWTREAESALNQNLADPAYAGSRLVDVVCKEAICKIRLQHDDEKAWFDFRPAMRKPPFDSNMFFNFDPATRRSVVYVARRGQDLPRAPKPM